MPPWIKAIISAGGFGIAACSMTLGALSAQEQQTLKSRTPEQNHARYSEHCAKKEAYTKASGMITSTTLSGNGAPLTLTVIINPQSAFTKACVADKAHQHMKREQSIEMLSGIFACVALFAGTGALASLLKPSSKPASPNPEQE